MNKPELRKSLPLALAILSGFAGAVSPTAMAASRTYTTNADFDQGTLFNVNYNTPDQLQLNAVATAFPIMWIANGGEDTVSKIDTNTGREVARYRTGFGPAGQPGHLNHLGNPWAGPAPSRTAVDAAGNVYVANRHFDNKQSTLVKILATGGIDRNGNGTIETSSDLNNDGVITNPSAEILPMGDTNGNGILDPNEIQDERIAWSVRIGAVNGICRSLSIGPDGHLWFGLYNTQQYYKVSSVDGSVLAGPISVGNYPYGSLVESNGTLFGAGLNNRMIRMNTTPPYNPQLFFHSGNNYGIALGNGKVYLALRDNGTNPIAVFDPNTNTFSYISVPGLSGVFGISVNSSGDIFLSASNVTGGGNYRGAMKLRADGSIIWSKPAQGAATGGDQRGAIVDSNGDVWTVNRQNHSVSKFRGTDGAALGVFPVGNQPYTYSDASGSAFLQSNPAGNWTVVHDTGYAGTSDATVSWNASVPPSGASFQVEVRAADTQAALATKSYATISNGGSLPAGVAGRYIEIKASLSGTAGQTLITPILYDLTIVTNQGPSVTCPPAVGAQCPGPQTLTFTAADVDSSSLTYDILVNGVSVQTGSVAAGGSFSLNHTFASGTHSVVARVSDGRSTGMCTTTVNVKDTQAPTVTCPADIVVSTAPGRCDATVTYSVTATDNCSAVTLAYSHPSGSTFPKGTTIVNVKATDASGNVSGCSFKVTVNDTEAPSLVCPKNIVVSNDPGLCSAVVNFAATATDNCGAASVTYSVASGSVFNKGTTTVTATATDAAGNTSTCDFTVTVNDTEAPKLACPSDIVVKTDPGLCSAVVTFEALSKDNCGTATVTYSHAPGSAFAKGKTTVTATATDSAGNTTTCSFTVTVNDAEPPTITCPSNIVVNSDPGLCTAVVTFDAKASDNCDSPKVTFDIPSGTAFKLGVTTVTATAVDSSGNKSSCTFTVTVKDGEAPKLACPPNVVVSTDPGLCTAVVHFSAKAVDNCGQPTLSYSIASGSAFPKGSTPVTVTATDSAGNTSSCTFTVTVNDTELPKLACPTNIVVNTDPGLCTAVVTFAATATDNCGATVSYSIAPGSAFPKGTTTVTATATDAAGNKVSCDFTVTVKDAEAPKITCPANIVVGNDPGNCTAVVSYSATATDNCGATISYSIAPGSVFPKGTTAVTATATDAAGNSTSCTFTVTVNDTQAPVGTCVPTTNPAGNNEPKAGTNPKSGHQNPDGFYQLLGSDNCDATGALAVYIKDSASSFIAGPFKHGDKVKITQAPGVTPNSKPMAGVIVAHIQLKGDALLVVTDTAGNTSVAAACTVPPGKK